MDINLTKLSVNEKDLKINIELIDSLYQIIDKNAESVFLLDDKYYNNFFDNEISLFWFFFKTYVGFKNLKNDKSTNFECIQILENDKLTYKNKAHIIKFKHNEYLDFFTNLKRINKNYNNEINKNTIIQNPTNSNFISYINDCGFADNWRFFEKNIEKVVMNSTEVKITEEHIFLASKKLTKENSKKFRQFYCLIRKKDDKELTNTKSEIKRLVKDLIKNNNCEKIIILKNIFNDDELGNYNKLIEEEKEFFKENNIIFLLRYNYKSKIAQYLNIKKLIINSSITFNNSSFNFNEILIKNQAASFLLELLKLKYKSCNNDDYINKSKIKKTSNLIFKYIFMGELKFKKIEKFFNEFYIEDEMILEKIHEELDKLKNKEENIFELEDNIKLFIENENIKEIYIGKSNFCLKNEELQLIQSWLTELIENNSIKIEILNKSHPIEMSKDALLIYFGEDNILKYFKSKIKILNIKLDYFLDDIDMEMINDFERNEDREFKLKSYHSSEIIPQNKQVLYYLDNDFNIYADSIEEIYDSGIESAFILTDFSEIGEYCKNFIQSYTKNSQTRKKIKMNAQSKNFRKESKYTSSSSSKEHFDKVYKMFFPFLTPQEVELHQNTIKNNLHSWIGGETLPRNSNLFIKFLNFINLGSEAEKLLKEHRYETSLNQNGGREISKQIQQIFYKDWDDNDDYNNLVQELKKSKIFKKCTIEENEEKENGEKE